MTLEASKKHPIFTGIDFGIGTWAWGDRLFWGYGGNYSENDLREAFNLCVKSGVRLFDSAEAYGQGSSERFLGQFVQESGAEVRMATKFSPYFWRLSARSFRRALVNSLKRLRCERVALYQIHLPMPPVRIQAWMASMAEAVQDGLIEAVGVSNFSRDQMQKAFDELAKYGIPLASNQMEYHLLDRRIEKNGLLRHCEELGVTLIAYSPIAKGVLSGKYTPERPVRGFRESRYNRRVLEKVQPFIRELRRIGDEHGGKTPAQVAINWVQSKGTIPIPGVKNLKQAQENLGAVGWRLSEEAMAKLDDLSERLNQD